MSAVGDFFTNLASGVATAGLNYGLSELTAQRNAAINYDYNEKAAQNADRRTRALYADYMSPAARIRQLKEAGLSPSLFADGAGGGSMGMTSGAQSGGASGVSSNVAQMSPPDIAATRLANAQADKAEAEAATERGENERGNAEINQLHEQCKKTIEETNNTALKNAWYEYENALQSLRVGYEASTFDAKIETFLKELDYLKYKTKSAKIKADIDENTQNDVQQLIHENVKNIIADTLYKRAQKELAGKQVQVGQQQIEDLISQIENRGKQTQINRDTLNQAIKEWATENGLIFGDNASIKDYWQKVLFGEHSHELLIRLIEALKK